MKFVTLLDRQPGPLPIRGGQFYIRSNGKARLFLSGTAWRSDLGKSCAVLVTVNDPSGKSVVSYLTTVYPNEVNTHKTLVSLFSDEFEVRPGTYYYSVTAEADTRSDANDVFSLTLLVYDSNALAKIAAGLELGTLPRDFAFADSGEGRAQLFVNASAYRTRDDGMIGVAVSIDDTPLGMAAIASRPQSHTALVPAIFDISLGGKMHRLTLQQLDEFTATNHGDPFGAWLIRVSDARQYVASFQGGLPHDDSLFADRKEMLLIAGGSVFAAAPGPIGMIIEIDGEEIARSVRYSNEAGVHQPLPPIVRPVPMRTDGKHRLRILPLSTNVLSDGNDLFRVALLG